MSKSVRLSARAAATGTTKKTAITSRAGPAKHHPARSDFIPAARPRVSLAGPHVTGGGAREHPASLLQDRIDALVQFPRGPFHRDLPGCSELADQPQFIFDVLPFRHLRRRLGELQLLAEGPCIRIGGQ